MTFTPGWRAAPAPSAARPGSGVGRWVRASPLSAFFLLAYLLSWVYWVVALGLLGRDTLAWFVPGAFGPPVAALVVTAVVDGRDGTRAFLRRWALWRVAPRWYLLALVALPALGLVVGLPFRDGTERLAIAGSFPTVVVSYLAILSFLVVLGVVRKSPAGEGSRSLACRRAWGR